MKASKAKSCTPNQQNSVGRYSFRPLTITTWKRKGGNRVRKEGKPNLWCCNWGCPLYSKDILRQKGQKATLLQMQEAGAHGQELPRDSPGDPVLNAPKQKITNGTEG
jgi:hypothetical protein